MDIKKVIAGIFLGSIPVGFFILINILYAYEKGVDTLIRGYGCFAIAIVFIFIADSCFRQFE